MNEASEGVESGGQSGSENPSTSEVTVQEVDYSDQLDTLVELQYWSFGLFAVFVGIFISFLVLNIIKRYF